jgi:lysophospholipase L1-like esterase
LELHLLSLITAGVAACAPASAPRAADAPVAESSPSDAATVGTAPVAANPAPASSAASAAEPAPPSAATNEAVSAIVPEQPLPKGTLVLHIGDSFAAALGVPLAKRLKAAGLRNVVEFKTSSYIPTWAFGPELTKYVSNYNPDLVLITLGANEIEIPDPPQRVGAIKRLVATVGGRPCVWISPPLWKKDTGLMAVIRANAAPCHYLDSDTIVHDLPRAPDKIHPSTVGREVWADAVFSWLGKELDPKGSRPWALRAEAAPTP